MRTLTLAALACLLINFSVCKAEALNKMDKILCVVSSEISKKAEVLSVVNTWARQCDKVLLFPNPEDETLPEYTDGIENQIGFYQNIYAHIYDNYENDFSWVIMASWNSHLIMDNVRSILAKQPNRAAFLGSKDGNNNAFSRECGTMMNMKALKVFQQKLASSEVPDFKLVEEFIYTKLKDAGVQVVDFCKDKNEKVEIPNSVDKFIARSSGITKCCSESCIAMKGASIYENFEIDRLIKNEEIAKIVESKLINMNEGVEESIKKAAAGLEQEIRLCSSSAENNSVNYTKIEWGKRWDEEWDGLCNNL